MELIQGGIGEIRILTLACGFLLQWHFILHLQL